VASIPSANHKPGSALDLRLRRRTLRVLGALAAGTTLLDVRAAPSVDGRPGRAVQFDRGLLWRVSRGDARPTYLFGTLHLDDDRVTALAPQVAGALDAASVLVIELLNDEDAVTRFRAALRTAEPALRDRLGADRFAEVARALDAHDVPRAKQPYLTAWAALLTLLQPIERQGIILDHVLVMRAQGRGKRVVALETVDEQIAAFAGLPEGTQLALLADAARHQERIQAAVRPLLDAYLARDLAAMARINREAMGDEPDLREDQAELLERVLYARNRRFVERIVPHAKRGGAFIAFGALHLQGPQGVLAGLADRGYVGRRVW
jgi:uncharacterized protein YbaP (TraB family)